MMAIRSYFAFIIIVTGTLLSAQEISDEEKQQYFKEILEAHNDYRNIHGSKPLILDEEMCEIAKIIVEEWIEKSNNLKVPQKYGSNSIMIDLNYNPILDTKMLVRNWYNYESIYKYYNEPLSRKPSDPFTQIIWKSTKQLGVGIYQKNNIVGVLVLYFPAGNQKEKYSSNVINPQEANWQKMQLTNSEEEQFIQGILKAHNYYRKMHKSPKLILDRELCELAKMRVTEWVTYPTHQYPEEFGVYYDTIFFNSKSTLDSTSLVTKWYDCNQYEYIRNPTKPHATNSSTKLIWKGPEKIGVGVLVVGSVLYVVVIYSPGQNQSEQYHAESSSRNY